MLGLAFGQKNELEDLDARRLSGQYATEQCASLSPGDCQTKYENERGDIADKGKLYANLIFLYVGAVFIVPAIVAVVVGHAFAKEETEKPLAAKDRILESLSVALVPSGKEPALVLSFRF